MIFLGNQVENGLRGALNNESLAEFNPNCNEPRLDGGLNIFIFKDKLINPLFDILT
jgi:hypothetical protein